MTAFSHSGVLKTCKDKRVKIFPVFNELSTSLEDIWKSGGTLPPFLTLALDGGSNQFHVPVTLCLGRTMQGTQGIRGWVGPTASLDIMEEEKSLAPTTNRTLIP
jgi:hypothetical protein